MRLAIALLLTLVLPMSVNATNYEENTKRATVLIISYDVEGDIIGRGSGFYVDEGIVITNIHVIDGYARYYRIFATNVEGITHADGCFKDINRSDIKINLEDDVAYIRVYIDCPHTSVFFADKDPEIGDAIGVYGYPTVNGDFYSTFSMFKIDGDVLSEWPAEVGLKKFRGPWYYTDAPINGGNSGGPIVDEEGRVVGIAVASHRDAQGNAVDGMFIPVSIIRSGLENANDSSFGYTPQDMQKNTVYDEPEPLYKYGDENDPFNPLRTIEKATDLLCKESLGQGGEATGTGGCRCKASYHKSDDEQECLVGAEGWTDPYYTIKTPKANEKTVPLFTDYNESQKGYEAVAALKKAGVLSGYNDGSFNPLGTVNRAELLKIIVEGFFAHEVKGESHCFADVLDEWFAQYVCAAKRLGWVSGYDDNTFKPANPVNRAEGMKIVTSSVTSLFDTTQYMPPDVEEGSWFYAYVAKGLELGILKSRGMFRPAANLTREDAAIWIYNGA